ncbi:hypothetical protein CHS0354_011714 [Potamilus streckersoni]|uniref:C1q domain-containing protein n=1 Tax=Potamilus streckersoni TaxID=2493646 RepID=A0AAE0SJN7_9BIVA|nr:hypothetical protein CHS0354_011714 [Potamilus streckersoni]
MRSLWYLAIRLVCVAGLIRGEDAGKRLVLDGETNLLHLIQAMKVEMATLNNTLHNLMKDNQLRDAKIASVISTVYNLTLTNEAEETLIGALVKTIHNITQISKAHEAKIRLLEQALSQVMHNLPAFMVTLTRSISHCSEGEHVVFDNSLLNVGNVYDTRRGVFQAPVSGTYQFSLTLGLDVNAFHVGIIKGNITNYIGNLYASHDANGDWRQRSTTVLIHLEKGDQVRSTVVEKEERGDYMNRQAKHLHVELEDEGLETTRQPQDWKYRMERTSLFSFYPAIPHQLTCRPLSPIRRQMTFATSRASLWINPQILDNRRHIKHLAFLKTNKKKQG